MKNNIKITFEINEHENLCYVYFPDFKNKEEKIILSEKTATFLTNLQTGQLMSLILHSIVEGGILNSDKVISDLIIKKIMQSFLFTSEEKPVVTPSDAFIFKEK